jgi:hypothetical protein
MSRDGRFTYTFPVLIGHVSVLESEINLPFQICRKVIVAIDHLCVAPAFFDEVGNLRWRHAPPDHVRATKRQTGMRHNVPMFVCPAGVVLDSDLCGKAKLALLDLDTCGLALGILATGASILRLLCA